MLGESELSAQLHNLTILYEKKQLVDWNSIILSNFRFHISSGTSRASYQIGAVGSFFEHKAPGIYTTSVYTYLNR